MSYCAFVDMAVGWGWGEQHSLWRQTLLPDCERGPPFFLLGDVRLREVEAGVGVQSRVLFLFVNGLLQRFDEASDWRFLCPIIP